VQNQCVVHLLLAGGELNFFLGGLSITALKYLVQIKMRLEFVFKVVLKLWSRMLDFQGLESQENELDVL
jgi:hypothetical protein